MKLFKPAMIIPFFVLCACGNSGNNNADASTSSKRPEFAKTTIGTYQQAAEGEKTAIEWDILEQKDGKALIISRYVLDVVPYSDEDSNNYANSTIRNWLNTDFYNAAFSAEEKERVSTTTVDNSTASTTSNLNQWTCEDTLDKIFLLSSQEIIKYYPTGDYLSTGGTEYALAHDLWYGRTGLVVWWLRSPGSYEHKAVAIHFGSQNEFRVTQANIGVRPACWITL